MFKQIIALLLVSCFMAEPAASSHLAWPNEVSSFGQARSRDVVRQTSSFESQAIVGFLIAAYIGFHGLHLPAIHLRHDIAELPRWIDSLGTFFHSNLPSWFAGAHSDTGGVVYASGSAGALGVLRLLRQRGEHESEEAYAEHELRTFADNLMSELPGQQELWESIALLVDWSAFFGSQEIEPDPEKQDELKRYPKVILRAIERQGLWTTLATDSPVQTLRRREREAWDAYVREPTWIERCFPSLVQRRIAYFSAEYGLQFLKIYGGGLGILSGDHLRGASDLGLDFTGVGLLYPQGYFKQRIAPDGT